MERERVQSSPEMQLPNQGIAAGARGETAEQVRKRVTFDELVTRMRVGARCDVRSSTATL